MKQHKTTQKTILHDKLLREDPCGAWWVSQFSCFDRIKFKETRIKATKEILPQPERLDLTRVSFHLCWSAQTMGRKSS